MECWICLCWIYCWTAVVSADLTYTIHRTKLSFNEAKDRCSPAVLTTLATQEEVSKVLKSISTSLSPVQHQFTLWVGLRKLKNECVIPTLSLRGFKWTDNSGEEAQVSRWREEPEETCTTVRCAAITGELTGLSVTDWGLIPVSCTNRYQFICKHRDGQVAGPEDPAPETMASKTELKTLETHSVTPDPDRTKLKNETTAPDTEPKETETGSAAIDLDPEKPKTAPEGQGPPVSDFPTPVSVTSEPKHPEAEDELTADLGLEPNPRPPFGSVSCANPIINGSRILIPDPDNSSRMGVDCFSGVRLELFCLDAIWWLLDAPVNTSSACWPCHAGFRKDIYGNCVDVDECVVGSSPCRHTCLNTEGSFRCICTDSDGKPHQEGSAECKDTLSGILLLVLVPVGVLVVLVVGIVVLVKCCLMRRSKKRAIKKAEKMAMKNKNSKESCETANERTVA
ncbi:C-type lectin domain family 14 member A [Sphaeramia orbicularis]|uniref:C-type lectin domain family 14 member A n=1 Tax=Sphaeramia orbicularis TaxID=375764 RepID=UPI00117C9EDA|nr:complement component C1q receptor-like [Sphaeramia orbicularis]